MNKAEFLDHALYINRPRYDPSQLLARTPGNIGRFLLVFAAVEMLSMPLTQYAWTWDHFLHGGMDFESSLLFLVVCLGFLLVLRHLCRPGESLRAPRWRLSLPVFGTGKFLAMPGNGVLLALHRADRAGSDLAMFTLPLQI
jgi:hypothetical protein